VENQDESGAGSPETQREEKLSLDPFPLANEPLVESREDVPVLEPPADQPGGVHWYPVTVCNVAAKEELDRRN
jgi:hypothetical protein